MLEGLRKDLAVNFALSKEYIKDAIEDGKQQLDESAAQTNQLNEQNGQLGARVRQLESHILLTEKTADLPEEKAKYIYRVLSEKTTDFINENFDYTLKLFDRTEEEKLEQYKKQAETKAENVDRPVLTEQVKNKHTSTDSDKYAHVENVYMGELGKF